MSDFPHAINLTHDGTLILRIPKGYKVDKVVVEKMGTENRVEYQPTHPTPSNTLGVLDCVSREELTKRIEAYFDGLPIQVHYDMLALAQKLPSVHPRKGKWIGYNADDKDWQRDDGSPIFMNCSECHEAVINNGSAHWNFCPNCGADMRGEQNE